MWIGRHESNMESALKKIPAEPKPEVTPEKFRHHRKELHTNILKRMEFYFGEKNLRKDRYLRKLVDEDPWVDLNIFTAFEKIQTLTTEISRIAKALKKSTMLDVSEDGTKVRRKTPVRKKDNSEECSVFVQRLPPDADQDWISNLLSQYGPIDYISIPKNKNKAVERSAIVEYNTPKDARKCIKAFRVKSCELSSRTSPDYLLNIIALADRDKEITKGTFKREGQTEDEVETGNCEESDLKKDSRSQVPQNGKKKKKKRISIDETTSANEGVEVSERNKKKGCDSGTEREHFDCVLNPFEVEEEHQRSRKRNSRNSESLNALDEKYKLNDSCAFECDIKRKKMKQGGSVSESTKKSVQKIKILPEIEICNNPKERENSDSEEERAIDKDKCTRSKIAKKIGEKKNDFESMEEAQPSDERKLQKKKKKKKGKRISVDETASANEEVEGSKIKKKRHNMNTEQESSVFVSNSSEVKNEHRIGRNLEISNASDVSYELNDSCAFECYKKRKKVKEECSEPDPMKQRVQKTETLSEIEICSNSKKRKSSGPKEEAANGKEKCTQNVITKKIKENEPDFELMEEAQPSDKRKVQKEKKKKKKKQISIDETASSNQGAESSTSKKKRHDSDTERESSGFVSNLLKVKNEHKRGSERSSGSLNASDGNYELNDQYAFECDKKRKKITQEGFESASTRQSVQKMKTLPEVEIRNDSEKRKLNDSKAGNANDKEDSSRKEKTDFKRERESDSDLIEEAKASDNVKAPKRKRKKCERKMSARKEDLGASDTGLEITAKGESKELRNTYLEVQRSTGEEKNVEKEEPSGKDVIKEEKSATVPSTPEVIVNIKMESSCSDPKNSESLCLVPGRQNVIINHNANHKPPAKIEGDSPDVSIQDLSDTLLNSSPPRTHLPHRLIEAMYQLDISVLCLLRKFTLEDKYPLLSLGFGDSEIDKFNNIVFRYGEKSIHIQIQNVEKRYVEDKITYDSLFTTRNRNFSINTYMNSFAQHLISEEESSSNSIEYLVIYTNLDLDLTDDMRFKQGRSKKCYPFKFDRIMNCDVLEDFFVANDPTKKQGFYQFSQDEITRKEFLKRLRFSSATQKLLTKRNLTRGFEKDLKEDFFEKLVLAVNQPKRKELSSIIKNEVEKSSKFQYDYTALREKVLRDLTTVGNLRKSEKTDDYVPRITYEFNCLMLLLHDMFLHKHILSINFEGKSDGVSNDITINYRGRITCIKPYTSDTKIGYSQLFSAKKNNTFHINKHFTFFSDDLEKDIRYFIIYTNADLDLAEENQLKGVRSEDFYPFKFCSIDIQKKKYKIFRDISCINANSLFQFAQDKTTRDKLLNLLKLPPFLQKEKEDGKFSEVEEREIKEKFLNKLIFAVNQPSTTGLMSVIRDRIKNDNESKKVPYNYHELYEIASRWSVSHGVGAITQKKMKQVLEGMNNNRPSYEKIRDKNISEEIKFATIVVGRQNTLAFDQFLDFLIKGEKLEILKRKGINPVSMSNMLKNARSNAVEAFKDLYNLLLDKEGNKMQYLKTLDANGVNIKTISSMLNGAGVYVAQAFKDLYNIWFDAEGNKTQYLKTLEKQGVNLSNVSSLLTRAGANAPRTFKELFDLWFDKQGNKSQHLKTLEKEGVNLSRMSSVLNGARSHAVKAFKNLYDLWFDENGNKTQYLKVLEVNEIKLTNISSILSGSGINAAKSFKDLYDLWFDIKGNKTQYFNNLEEKEIKLTNVSSILSGAGANAARGFKDLYDLWFDVEGNKTQYLAVLEEKGINLMNISSILHRAGAKAAKAFKDLYDLWFDEGGNETHYLKTLEEKEINLTNLSSILHGAGAKAAKAFVNLYNIWFDSNGNETKYLKTLEERGIKIANVCTVLNGAGANAALGFEELYDLWFDSNGDKTQYLKTLEKKSINLLNISSILNGSEAKAPKAFRELYDLWFDSDGNETRYLKSLEGEGINLTNMSSILSGAGTNSAKAFKDLHNLWFDARGNKTKYITALEEKGINLANMSSILNGSGAKAPKAFEELFNLWLYANGNKTLYLKTLEEEDIKLTNMSSILSGAGANAAKSFQDLYNLWFDGKGKKNKIFKNSRGKGIKSGYYV